MNYLTQATYNSPGARADQPKTEICRGGQSNSGKDESAAMPLNLAQVDKEMPAVSPGQLLTVVELDLKTACEAFLHRTITMDFHCLQLLYRCPYMCNSAC